jgi:dimethylargininase
VPAPSIPRRVIASLVTALVVAATAHGATLFVFIVANQLNSNIGLVPAVHERFIAASLLLLIALFVFGFIGIFRAWYTALVTGFVFAVAAALGGTTVYATANGQEVSVLDQLALLLGVNLPFVVAGTLAAVFAGPRLHRRLLLPVSGADAGAGRRVALVRVPADNLADGMVRGVRLPVDVDLANQQWDDYVSAFLENGWSTIEVEPAAGLADSVFVEDPAVVVGDLAVIASPGAAARRAESAEVEASLVELGLCIRRIEEPGTLDGGDVLRVGGTVYVGSSERTNAEGIRQLRGILTDHAVVAVPVTRALHLKSAVTALPDGTVLGHPETVDEPRLFERYLEVPEPQGTRLVVLAPDTVLMAASAPRSVQLVESLGYRVVVVDISEFEKLDASVTCLSIRIR